MPRTPQQWIGQQTFPHWNKHLTSLHHGDVTQLGQHVSEKRDVKFEVFTYLQRWRNYEIGLHIREFWKFMNYHIHEYSLQYNLLTMTAQIGAISPNDYTIILYIMYASWLFFSLRRNENRNEIYMMHLEVNHIYTKQLTIWCKFPSLYKTMDLIFKFIM